MSELIIDVTELAQWQGKLTGVPRVMDELSRRFAIDADLNKQFVMWDSAVGKYKATTLDQESSNADVGKPQQLNVRSRLVRKAQRHSRLVSKSFEITQKRMHADINDNYVTPKSGDILLIMADWHGSDPAFVSYITNAYSRGVRLIQMCYDLLPIVTPQYSGHATTSLRVYSKAIYPLCEAIFVISEHTKRDVKEWLKKNKLKIPPIIVIRLGDDFKLAEATAPKNADFLKTNTKSKDYILCVGTFEARKNHTLLYYTYKLAKQQKIELPPLVIVGRRGWKSDDIYEIITNDPETKDQFVFQQDTSDEELAWLYKHCLFTIYPSFYEGWGLPIAESVANNIPCIASNTSSMPEVAGNLISYFNPASTDDCLKAITDMLKPGAIDHAKRKISEYKLTSWNETFITVKKHIGELYANKAN